VEESVLSKLSGYGTAIERQTYRALHEPECRRAARRGAALTPPYVVDVEVSGMPEETGALKQEIHGCSPAEKAFH
jgi:hypothetical protein